MTALRHDAHAAPPDYLHVQAPGPVDWWNHFSVYLSPTFVQGYLKAPEVSSFGYDTKNCQRLE